MIVATSSFPIVSPAAAEGRRARPHQHHRATPLTVPPVDLRQYLADDTDRAPPPPIIGVRTVAAMQWVIFVAVLARWLFW